MMVKIITITVLLIFSSSVFSFEFTQARIDFLIGSAWIKSKEKKEKIHTGQVISVMDELLIDDGSEIYITYWHPQTKRQALQGLTKNNVNNTIWDTIKPADFERNASAYFSTNVPGGGSRDDNDHVCLLPETVKLPAGVGEISLTAATCALAENVGITAKLINTVNTEDIESLVINTNTIEQGNYTIEFKLSEKTIHTAMLEIISFNEIKISIQKVASNYLVTNQEDFEEVKIIASYINGYILLADALVYQQANRSDYIENNKKTDWPIIIKSFIANNFTSIALPQK